MKNSYKLSILGEQYSIVSSEQEQELVAAAALVDSTMKEIVAKIGVDHKRVAILAALQIAHKYLMLEQEKGEHAQALDRLINQVEQAIKH